MKQQTLDEFIQSAHALRETVIATLSSEKAVQAAEVIESGEFGFEIVYAMHLPAIVGRFVSLDGTREVELFRIINPPQPLN